MTKNARAVLIGISLGLFVLLLVLALLGEIDGDDLPWLITMFTAVGTSTLAAVQPSGKGRCCRLGRTKPEPASE